MNGLKDYRLRSLGSTEALDPATRTLLVEIDVQNKDHRLQPGMFLNASLHLQQHPNALAIPPASIVPSTNGHEKSVFVVDSGKTKRVAVKTGIDDGLWVEVVEGLTGEEEVVVVGKSGLIDGQAVLIVPLQPSNRKISQAENVALSFREGTIETLSGGNNSCKSPSPES